MTEHKDIIEAEAIPTQAIAVRQPSGGLSTVADLEQQFALAVRQRELLSEYIKKQLKPGQHYYQRGDQKPSLSKEGAEIILMPHNLAPDYQLVSGPEAPPDGDRPYQITVKCVLRSKGNPDSFVGSGMGSAGSHHGYWDKRANKFEYKPRQPDKYLCHNATLKMAQKSAMIAATINSTAASEFFTQDVGEPDAAPELPKGSGPLKDTTPPPKAQPATASAKLPPSVVNRRKKFIENLETAGLRDKAMQYLIDIGWLMSNEPLEKMEDRFVPVTAEHYTSFLAKLLVFSGTGRAERPFEPPPKAEIGHTPDVPRGTVNVPRDKNIDCNSPDAPWRSFPVPFGKHAGTKLADLDKNVLWGFWANYKVEKEYVGKNGQTYQTKPEKLVKDKLFREMLDEAGKHYEFTKKEEDEEGDDE